MGGKRTLLRDDRRMARDNHRNLGMLGDDSRALRPLLSRHTGGQDG